jgi:hypothetical protein
MFCNPHVVIFIIIIKDISSITAGLNIWKQALLNGHLPEFDTNTDHANREVTESYIWPEKVLSKELNSVFTRLELPFLTNRHPELIPSVLKALLEITINFSNRVIEKNANIDDRNETEKKIENEDDTDYFKDTMHEEYLTDEDKEGTCSCICTCTNVNVFRYIHMTVYIYILICIYIYTYT